MALAGPSPGPGLRPTEVGDGGGGVQEPRGRACWAVAGDRVWGLWGILETAAQRDVLQLKNSPHKKVECASLHTRQKHNEDLIKSQSQQEALIPLSQNLTSQERNRHSGFK